MQDLVQEAEEGLAGQVNHTQALLALEPLSYTSYPSFPGEGSGLIPDMLLKVPKACESLV